MLYNHSMPKAKPLSLHPLKLKEALKILVNVKPVDNTTLSRQKKAKKASPSS
jgi:hypothetical protein